MTSPGSVSGPAAASKLQTKQPQQCMPLLMQMISEAMNQRLTRSCLCSTSFTAMPAVIVLGIHWLTANAH